MPTKEQLIDKLVNHKSAKNFTKKDFISLMGKCGCSISQGGRGSGIRVIKPGISVTLKFDLPHPQKELYGYQRKMTVTFLQQIGEIKNEK